MPKAAQKELLANEQKYKKRFVWGSIIYAALVISAIVLVVVYRKPLGTVIVGALFPFYLAIMAKWRQAVQMRNRK